MEVIPRIDFTAALAELESPDEAVGQGLLALDSPRLVRLVLVRAADLDATVSVATRPYPRRSSFGNGSRRSSPCAPISPLPSLVEASPRARR
jgi:hypothetical protein